MRLIQGVNIIKVVKVQVISIRVYALAGCNWSFFDFLMKNIHEKLGEKGWKNRNKMNYVIIVYLYIKTALH